MKYYLLLVLFLMVAGCSEEPEELVAEEPTNPLLETYFDLDYSKDYTDITYPRHYDNRVLNDDNTPGNNLETNDGIILGRVLFYDKNLSRNNSVSCSSCHQQSSGFTDSKTLSEGFEGGLTGAHSMRIANVWICYI